MKEKLRRKIPALVNRESGGAYIMEKENSRDGMETLKKEPVSRLPLIMEYMMLQDGYREKIFISPAHGR